MDRARTLRNIAIIVVIAAAVRYLPGGGRGADTFEAALWVAFFFAIAMIGMRLYREHRVAIYGLGDRHRLLLYAGIALGMFAWASRTRMWSTGFGELGWWVIVGLAVWALMEVFRHSRSY
jgi:hypothetical protein